MYDHTLCRCYLCYIQHKRSAHHRIAHTFACACAFIWSCRNFIGNRNICLLQVHVNSSTVDTQLASAYFELGELGLSCAMVNRIHAYGGSKDGGFAASRCAKQDAAEQWLKDFVPPLESPKLQTVPRRHVKTLSFREFYEEFALKSRPLVIEGYPTNYVCRKPLSGASSIYDPSHNHPISQ